VAGCWQELVGAARGRQEPPGAARSRQEPPGAARRRQEPPGHPRAPGAAKPGFKKSLKNLRKMLVLALPISGNDAASNLSQIAPITCASEALQVRFMGPRRIDFLRRQN